MCDMDDSFDCGYHLYAKEKHNERVAKNPERIAYAIKQFEAHGIEYQLKNEQTGVCARNILQVANKTPYNGKGQIRKTAGGYIWRFEGEVMPCDL